MKQRFNKKLLQYLFILIGAVLLLIVGWFANNLARSVVLIMFFLLANFLCLRNKNVLMTAFLMLIFILPYNININLPQKIETLNIYDPLIYGVPSSYYTLTVSILDALVFSVSFYEIVQMVIYFSSHKITRKNKYIFIIFTTLFSGFILQNLFANKGWDTISFFRQIRFLLYIFAIVIFGTKIKNWFLDKNFLNLMKWGILFNVFLQVLIALMQFLGGSSVGLQFLGESKLVAGFYGSSSVVFYENNYLRGYGTFAHPNILGAFLLLMLIILYRINFKNKLLPFLIIFVGVLLTFSRMAIIMYLIFLLLMIYEKFKQRFKIKNIKIKNANINKLNSFAVFGFLSRFTSIFDIENSSVSERIKLVKVAISLLKENFLIGVGSGNFIKEMGEKAIYIIITNTGNILFEPVHNIFLLLLVENGVVFGGLIIFLITYLLIRVLKTVFQEKKLIIFGASLTIWLLVFGNFDHFLLTIPQGMGLAVVFASLSLGIIKKK